MDHSRLRPRSQRARSQSSTQKQIKYDKKKIKTSPCYFNDMPDEICVLIFRYLTMQERFKVGSVCKKWYRISRDPDPVFWREVDLEIPPHLAMPQFIKKLLNEVLPSCVLHLRLNLDDFNQWEINFSIFATQLKNKFPRLQSLCLHQAVFKTTKGPHVILNFINLLPESLKTLSLMAVNLNRSRKFQKFDLKDVDNCNIEILCLSFCDLDIDPPVFLKMPHLKELYLASHCLQTDFFDSLHSVMHQLNVLDVGYSYIKSNAFQVIQTHGINLTELYICSSCLEDSDFILDSKIILPRLRILCLRNCSITCERLNKLIKSWSSLKLVYVGIYSERELENEFDYSQCAATTLEKISINNEVPICFHCEEKCYL